jgi:DNA-binding MarR family transcriptional regulator
VTSARSPENDVATRVWTELKNFVDDNEPRQELQEILGLGRGFGRVKLLLLLVEKPMTLREIADARGIDAPYATVIVDKLEGLGLVDRTAHPDDHRRKLVQLTPAGREAARLATRVLAKPPRAFASLSPSDLAQLQRILAQLAISDRDE